MMNIFINYAECDITYAERLYYDLKLNGFKPWLDKQDILPGQDRASAIRQTINKSLYFIDLLSKSSISNRNPSIKHKKIALDSIDEFPQNRIFVIPVRIDECEIGDERLRKLQYVDLFPSYEIGLNKILRALASQEENINKTNIEIASQEFFQDKNTMGDAQLSISQVGKTAPSQIRKAIIEFGAIFWRKALKGWQMSKFFLPRYSYKSIAIFITVLLLIVIALVLRLNVVSVTPHAQMGDEIAQRFINNVVQLSVTFSNGESEDGFGFVVGEKNDKVYVVTANHVIHPRNPDITQREILVRFYEDQAAKAVSGEPLNIASSKLDVALLRVSKPKEYIWKRNVLCYVYKKGDSAWFIGQNKRWIVPPDKVAGTLQDHEPDYEGLINFYITSVRPGTSGAPLFSENGIIGMIIKDDYNRAIAVHIDSIRKFITKECPVCPWELQANYSPTGVFLLRVSF